MHSINKTYSRFTIKIQKCTDEYRLEGDPRCSSESEIEEWIETKEFYLLIYQKEFIP